MTFKWTRLKLCCLGIYMLQWETVKKKSQGGGCHGGRGDGVGSSGGDWQVLFLDLDSGYETVCSLSYHLFCGNFYIYVLS